MKLADITSSYRSKIIVNTYKSWLIPESKVLDVGCGTGVVADELRKMLSLKIEGCDIQNYLIREIPFKKMISPVKLPYKSGEFQIAMFNDVLHHTKYSNQEKLLKEAIRVSKSILIFELIPTRKGMIADFIINKIHNCKMYIPFTYRSVEGWISLFKELGFKYNVRFAKKPLWYPFSHLGFRLESD